MARPAVAKPHQTVTSTRGQLSNPETSAAPRVNGAARTHSPLAADGPAIKPHRTGGLEGGTLALLEGREASYHPPAKPESRKREQFPVRKAAKAVLKVYRGANVTDALIATGIPRPTWYQWLKPANQWPTGEPFSEDAQTFAARLRHAFTRAQGLAAVQAQQSVYQARKSPAGTVEWRAGHEWLKHAEATRTRWHEHRELHVEQHGTVNLEHRKARQMTDDQLLEALPGEWRELCEPLQLPACDDGSPA